MITRTPLTGEWVILAPERDGRPNGYEAADCPFCPGAEDQTPPELLREGDPWRIRLFPNKYPASDRHEVLVESATHTEGFDDLRPGHAGSVVAVLLERYVVLRRSSPFVTLFKNHGEMAGATLPHPHSQILATPFAPARIVSETHAFANAEPCPLCDLSAHLLIGECRDYRWIAPRGSRMPWQQWIVPRLHANEMSEPGDLASLLQRAVHATRRVSAAYNWAFLNFPGERKAHWYLEIVPRLSPVAGFEIGSGTFLNTVEPEDAARVFRRADENAL